MESVTLDSLPGWLAGYWKGDGFGGTAEEQWLPPTAGTMAGTFRLTVGGEVTLFEFMTITLLERHPVLRVKHFNGDGSPWEEAERWVEFPFESIGERAIYFSGLSYESIDDQTMRVCVRTGRADGSSRVEELLLRRVG